MADRRRRHASLVAVWTEAEHDLDDAEYRLNIKNNGDQPIYDCRIAMAAQTGLVDAAFGTIAPGQNIAKTFFRVTFPEPPPGGWAEFDEDVYRNLRFRVTFTDTEGRAWWRSERGRLRRIRPRAALSLSNPLRGSQPPERDGEE